jgi:hypothetical protein
VERGPWDQTTDAQLHTRLRSPGTRVSIWSRLHDASGAYTREENHQQQWKYP